MKKSGGEEITSLEWFSEIVGKFSAWKTGRAFVENGATIVSSVFHSWAFNNGNAIDRPRFRNYYREPVTFNRLLIIHLIAVPLTGVGRGREKARAIDPNKTEGGLHTRPIRFSHNSLWNQFSGHSSVAFGFPLRLTDGLFTAGNLRRKPGNSEPRVTHRALINLIWSLVTEGRREWIGSRKYSISLAVCGFALIRLLYVNAHD